MSEPASAASEFSAGSGDRHYDVNDHVYVLVGDSRRAPGFDWCSLEDGLLRVRTCSNALELLYLSGKLRPGLIVLRATFPDAAVADLVTTIRLHDGLPVLVLVATDETAQAVAALEAGANELLEYPVRPEQVRAAIARHLHGLSTQRLAAAKIQVGGLVLDGPGYCAWANGVKLRLTTREFEVLKVLVSQAGRVTTFEEVRDLVWGTRGETVTPATIKVHMHRLRDHVAGAAVITAVRGVGYRLSA